MNDSGQIHIIISIDGSFDTSFNLEWKILVAHAYFKLLDIFIGGCIFLSSQMI